MTRNDFYFRLCQFGIQSSLLLNLILSQQRKKLPNEDNCLSLQFLLIRLVGRIFANGPGDLGSIPCRVIPKTLKRVLDTSLLNTQQYKVRIEGKVEQSWERSSALPYTLV